MSQSILTLITLIVCENHIISVVWKLQCVLECDIFFFIDRYLDLFDGNLPNVGIFPHFLVPGSRSVLKSLLARG